ncbi:MAG: hydroxymethylglutaryl-CoA reductase [Hellea sp.]|nr:hydroxymethylglutaryl-CoA reductase [Hellea sp.]
MSDTPKSIPRISGQNFDPDIIKARQDFITSETGTEIPHLSAMTIDPATLKGNIENPIGAGQIPIGLAGPLLVDGEYAKGHFYVPMATTEGTLVASYSRGMRILSAIGGVKTTIVERYMQRAPVFHCQDARMARELGKWIESNFSTIKKAAEATTSIGKLSHIEGYGVSRMWFTRFNFTTGDAAGQNMSGKAAQAACQWIMDNLPADLGKVTFTLSGAIDTDKKHSHLNTLHSRGARVVVEAVLPRDLMLSITRADTRDMYRARQISMLGGMLAGTTNNGVHAANGIAALFVATGQDEANVAESQAGLTYVELLDNDDLYWSLTLPSIIAATYGGGTGLATQRECLEIMDCYGTGKVEKFIEILAGTVLAGEISLSAAVVANEWVESHDRHGRNRP